VIFYLKALARGLILPPTGSLILTLLGVILIWRRRRFGWPVFVVGFASLWLLCTPIVADKLSALAEGYPALNPSHPVNAQAVVVLGGGGKAIMRLNTTARLPSRSCWSALLLRRS